MKRPLWRGERKETIRGRQTSNNKVLGGSKEDNLYNQTSPCAENMSQVANSLVH